MEGIPLLAEWRRGYLVWLDQHADEIDRHGSHVATSVTLEFDDSATGEGYQLYPVVPDVVPQVTPEGPFNRFLTDANGYAAISAFTKAPNPNWTWTGWNDAWDEAASSPEGPSEESGTFHVVVLQCDPASGTAIAPLLILTNAELVTT